MLLRVGEPSQSNGHIYEVATNPMIAGVLAQDALIKLHYSSQFRIGWGCFLFKDLSPGDLRFHICREVFQIAAIVKRSLIESIGFPGLLCLMLEDACVALDLKGV